MTGADAELVASAVGRDQDALAEEPRLVPDPVYRLALRMAGQIADAEDATQGILVRITTRPASPRRGLAGHLGLPDRCQPPAQPTAATYGHWK
jgi:DNA-directed RNA polymerase specialized sigma24 family protein